MKFMKLLSILTIFLMVTSISAQGPPTDIPTYNIGGDNVQAETDDFVVKVVGGQQVPFYTFWSTDDSDTRYMVMFDAIFEASDSNNNGQFDQGVDTPDGNSYLALQGMSWQFSDITEDSEGVHFNMTSNDGMITLQNHLSSGETSMKFDVIIDGYTFDSDNSILVFAFKVLLQGGDNVSPENEDSDRISFDDGFFEIEETAQDENGSIDVGLSSGSQGGEGKLYMAYEQFSGKMVHDPIVGIDGSSNTILLVGGAVVVIAIVGIVIYQRKKN